MTIGLKGLYTPGGVETRDIAYLDVDYNGNKYDWAAYIPQGVDVGQSLAAIETRIYAEIDAKEAEWANHPKTETVVDPITNEETTRDVAKEEVVCPEMPDYYAKRRDVYPPIGDQLGAIAKGMDSPEYLDILARIQAVKDKYPKPF